VHEHADVRICPDERARGTCVVEVDMGQQERADIAESDAGTVKRPLKGLQAGRRPGIDNRDAARPLHDAGGNGMWSTQELEIGPRQPL